VAGALNINDVLDGHVGLDIECLDRVYLNSPLRSRWDDRKVDHVQTYAENGTEPGVVAIVAAQEVQRVWMGYPRRFLTGALQLQAFFDYWIDRIALLLDASIRDRALLPADRSWGSPGRSGAWSQLCRCGYPIAG